MILVDTSVWIDYFNGRDTVKTNLLDAALTHDVVIMGDLILLEILQGFKSNKDYELAKDTLLLLPQRMLLNQELALLGAQNFRYLRKKGVTVRKVNDVIIATYCIKKNLPLLFSDKDFEPFVQYLHLQSVE